MKTSHPLRVLCFVIPLSVSLCGCFTSEQPFYDKRDIADDDRILGTFDAGGNNLWRVTKRGPGDYRLVIGEGNDKCSMTFSGVVFRLGTNEFIDLLPDVETCSSGTDPAGPGLVDLLQAATLVPLHLVVELQFGTNEIFAGGLPKDGEIQAWRKAPDFFLQNLPQTGDVSVRVGARLIPDTKRQRQFLIQFGNDTNVFPVQPLKRVTPPA